MKSDEKTSIWQKLLRLLKTEIGLYIFFGGLTTLVNLVVYTFFNSLLGERLWLISMTLSIGLSILFAYIVNRKFVFKSKNPIWPEIFHFFASRLLISFLFEVVTFQLIYNVFKFRAKFLPDLEYAKLIGQIAVVIGNYLVGKFAVFKPLKEAATLEDDHEIEE
ncbi:MAG TPA: GtrA family protein [Fastidiosipila sp.]|nr:GtrA family protein [Fastidiosipila sp.]